MRVRYIGPHIDGVDVVIPTDIGFIPETRDEAAAHGMIIHVPHKGVADLPKSLAERLAEQEANWELVKPTRTKGGDS